MNTQILTYTGIDFDILEPEKSEFDILDIAHALSMTCRFGGHCREFYSVAEHSVIASAHVPDQYRMRALLHDAAEAYIGDMVAPAKHVFASLMGVEDRIERALLIRFDIDPNDADAEAAVKDIDRRLLVTEMQQLMQRWDFPGLRGIEPLPHRLQCWTPETARGMFLAAYKQIERQTPQEMQEASRPAEGAL